MILGAEASYNIGGDGRAGKEQDYLQISLSCFTCPANQLLDLLSWERTPGRLPASAPPSAAHAPATGGQEAAVACPPRALLKASQARPRRGETNEFIYGTETDSDFKHKLTVTREKGGG